MSLGLSLGGTFTSYVKIDSRSGRVSRRKNADKGETADVDITNGFTAVFDLANIEVGWAMFAAGAAPAYQMVRVGQVMPMKPAGDNWKQGVKLQLMLPESLGGGVHEFSTTAKAVLGAIEDLHTAYASADESRSGLLPVVAMTDTKVVEAKMPNGSTTRNYSPVFAIKKWIERPAALGDGPAPVAAASVSPPAPKAAPAADLSFG